MKKIMSSSVLAALSLLLTACTGTWCKGKKASRATVVDTVVSVKPIVAVKPVLGNEVFFNFDSAELSADAQATAKARAAAALRTPGAKVTVTGHCSEEGSEAYNNGLGERRANSVASAIKENGVNHVKVLSYGKSIDFGHGLEQNRKAIIFLGDVDLKGGKVVHFHKKAAPSRVKKFKKSVTNAIKDTVAAVKEKLS